MLLDWHRRYYKWIQKKWKVTGYTMSWISFIKGLIIGLLVAIFLSGCSMPNYLTPLAMDKEELKPTHLEKETY